MANMCAPKLGFNFFELTPNLMPLSQSFVSVGNARFHHRGYRKWTASRSKILTEHNSRMSSRLGSTTEYSTQKPESHSTIDHEEVSKFSAMANLWWKESGELKALHTLNKLRIPLVRDALLQQNRDVIKDLHPVKPLTGFKILDVGCGGGILSEPLARLGAAVLGVDASEENVSISRAHASNDPSLVDNVKYEHSTVEDLVQKEDRFDAVVASEVVEHVDNNAIFVQACCDLVKPGGSVILTTLNQTYLSYVLGVFAAERIFRVVPEGAHDWNKFISPQDLQYLIEQINGRVPNGTLPKLYQDNNFKHNIFHDQQLSGVFLPTFVKGPGLLALGIFTSTEVSLHGMISDQLSIRDGSWNKEFVESTFIDMYRDQVNRFENAWLE